MTSEVRAAFAALALAVPEVESSYPYVPADDTLRAKLPAVVLLRRRLAQEYPTLAPYVERSHEFDVLVFTPLRDYQTAQELEEQVVYALLELVHQYPTLNGTVDAWTLEDDGDAPLPDEAAGWWEKRLRLTAVVTEVAD